MGCQFRADTFSFDGINFSEKHNIYLVSVGDNGNDTNINGQTVTIDEDSDTGDIKSFAKITRDYVDINITICKVIDNIIIPMSDDDLDLLNLELFKSNYRPFAVNNLIVNCIVKSSASYFNSANQGYINLVLHCEPFYRSHIISKEVICSTTKSIELINKTNIDEKLDVNIEIELYDSTTYVDIRNNSNGTEIAFNSLTDVNEKHIMVYGESINGLPMNYVQSVEDNSLNILKKMTVRDWIQLSYGVNRLSINCNGRARINISYQNKIMFR